MEEGKNYKFHVSLFLGFVLIGIILLLFIFFNEAYEQGDFFFIFIVVLIEILFLLFFSIKLLRYSKGNFDIRAKRYSLKGYIVLTLSIITFLYVNPFSSDEQGYFLIFLAIPIVLIIIFYLSYLLDKEKKEFESKNNYRH